MNTFRTLFLENPELWRNLRIELRFRRVVTAGIITAVFALIVLPSLIPGNSPGFGPGYTMAMSRYLLVVLWSQKITLALGGGILCWRAVRREREQNTYDFQRLTELSPLELAIGKLFGAPALAYFVTLCLVPPVILSAITTGGAALRLVLQSYLLLFTSSLVIHAFALMISTISDKGGGVSGVVLLLLLQAFPLIGWGIVMSGMANPNAGQTAGIRFYGMLLPPTLLWSTLELGFAAWLLLAVVRNIKLELEAVQLFTVRQGLGFALYCNFVWIGFFMWQGGLGPPSDGVFLLLGVAFFYAVGIGVVQSRESIRRGLRESGTGLLELGTLMRPIASFVGAALLTETLIATLATQHPGEDPLTRSTRNLILVLYFAVWLGRDLYFLQWMKVRPVRSPLRKAFLYLGVFYLSVSIVFRSSVAFAAGGNPAFSAWLAPFPLLTWTYSQWGAATPGMLLAFVAQLAAAGAFAYLYHQEVVSLGSRRPLAAPSAGPPHLSSSAP